MPVAETHEGIDSAPRALQNGVADLGLEDDLILREVDGCGSGRGQILFHQGADVHHIEQPRPWSATRLELAHQGHVEGLENVPEAEVHVGDPVADAELAFGARQPDIRGKGYLPSDSVLRDGPLGEGPGHQRRDDKDLGHSSRSERNHSTRPSVEWGGDWRERSGPPPRGSAQ